MTDVLNTEEVSGIALALAKAQSEMGRAIKDSANPHFKSKYADLASVMDACMGALNDNGIAVIQPMIYREGVGQVVKTQLVHGPSGESVACDVPLIVNKNDMQGLGSAITYARRYGLMLMAGIAADDDDGNAAVKAKPTMISNDIVKEIMQLVTHTKSDLDKLLGFYQVTNLRDMTADQGASALARLEKKLADQIKAETDKEAEDHGTED